MTISIESIHVHISGHEIINKNISEFHVFKIISDQQTR